MMSEYAYYYGPVDPEMAWPLFLAKLRLAPRFEARQRLSLFDSVRFAINAALAGSASSGPVEAARVQMEEMAYPVKRERQVIMREEDPVDG